MGKVFNNVRKVPFWVCLGFSMLLLVTSFIMPPSGKIDPSVIQAVGEVFGFAALYVVLEGLHRGTDVTISKGDLNVSLQNPDQKPDSQPEE